MPKTKPKNQHVIPYQDKWAVRGEGNERLRSVHNTQSEAINIAREIARNQRSDVIIHRADGRIRERDSYGGEPLPARSPRKVLFPSTTSVSDKERIRVVVKKVLSEPQSHYTKRLHVVPHSGNWAVRSEGNTRVTSIHDTQSQAIQAARNIANKRRSDVFIYKRDGSIREKDSYFGDASPSPDRKQ